jgi:hypothetical protein
VGWPPYNGQALTAAVNKILRPGPQEVQFVGRISDKVQKRRYIAWRWAEGVHYLQVELPRATEDVKLRFLKSGDAEWSCVSEVWNRQGQGWRRVTEPEEKDVLGELPRIEWMPRGDLQVGDMVKKLDADRTAYEYGVTKRKKVPDEVRGTELSAEPFYVYDFDPYDYFAMQGLDALRNMPSEEVLLENIGILLRELPSLDRDPVLTKFAAADGTTNPPTTEFELK